MCYLVLPRTDPILHTKLITNLLTGCLVLVRDRRIYGRHLNMRNVFGTFFCKLYIAEND